jgi:hypothetical protein
MIGKVVVSVEKKCKNHGNNKDDGSETSLLGPGIGETQQLMRATNFLEEDTKESCRDMVTQHNNTENGSDENGYKSPNLLVTTDNDDNETVLENKKESKPNEDDKGTIMQQLQEQEEISLGGTCKEAWWATCKFCNQFPCVWTQNAEAVVENDKVMHEIAVQPLLPPNLVCRQWAFMSSIATLV